MSIPKLALMVGVPASGKSKKAREMTTEDYDKIVSSDEIRQEFYGKKYKKENNAHVFGIFNKRINQYLSDGQNVIADATNITIKDRKKILNYVNGIKCVKEVYLMLKDVNDCREDNSLRKNTVPDDIIDQFVRKFQVPFYEEGYDVIKVCAKDSHCQNTFKEMIDFNQNNSHHTLTLDEHCQKVAEYLIDCGDEDLLLAARNHDYGKLFTQDFDDRGESHYYGHENVGAYKIGCILGKQHSDKMTLNTMFYINYHMLPYNWQLEKTITKYKKLFGEEKFQKLTLLHECDEKAH